MGLTIWESFAGWRSGQFLKKPIFTESKIDLATRWKTTKMKSLTDGGYGMMEIHGLESEMIDGLATVKAFAMLLRW